MTNILALILSLTAHAVTPNGVPSVTVSATGANTGQVTISPSDLSKATSPIFGLYGIASSATTGFFYSFYKNGVAYVTGTSTKAYCFDITAASSTASSQFQLVSSQAAIVNNTSTALTNPAYQGGGSGNYVDNVSASVLVPGVVPGVYVFGNGSVATYAGFQTQAASSQSFLIHMDCFEQ